MATTSAAEPKTNRIGLSVIDYKGGKTTLCAGCGHNAISERIIESMYEMGVHPERVAKLSGIGCSSKSPAYFMNRSHSFNSVHGRMPSVATGAMLANRNLIALGVSGDGDTASIGVGQFMHMMRRNLPIIYIIEDNGVYGLTKGQFSATADQGSKSKKGVVNSDSPLDLVGLAMQLGATFVARGFSGDKGQLVPLIKAAIAHKGAAFLDVISPCVAFNNHAGSTKSYEYVREHNEAVNRLDFIEVRAEITVDFAEGELIDVTQHDGSIVRLRKLSANFNPTDRVAAMNYVHERQAKGEVVTGLLYVDSEAHDLHEHFNTTETPINRLAAKELSPGAATLAKINNSLR
jgi:2-oxoglutarate ferredoxin oxidoreductase subunit beta